MDDTLFVGREQELSSLRRLLSKKTASLVVIKGRRRIGKSRLIEEFAKGQVFYEFSGLPPIKDTTAQTQRNEFARCLSAQTGIPEVIADDWSKLFIFLAGKVKRGRVIILFDEITWMAYKDPTFLGKLKNAWDLHFKKNSKLILILCGSLSTWIERNIISSTGFFGRISLKITLDELSLSESNQLLHRVGFKRSALEKFMILAVTGGIPWYIEQIDAAYSASDNIQHLCFNKDGILVDEYKQIFHNLFGRRSEICRRIVENLAQGSAEYTEIVSGLNYHRSGSLSDYLDDLITSGFIKRYFVWSIKSGQDIRLSQYRLSDNYLRFYLKYIAPQINKIKKGQFTHNTISTLPQWNAMMGYQFENLVLNNRKLVQNTLNIKPEDIICDNPFFQHETVKQKSCQIDYLIQTKHNTLFVCEVKFLKDSIKASIISEMKEKIRRLTLPRGFACIPVLIHVNGVSDDVEDANYFTYIIDFSRLLQ